ncbi:MAG: hypothetical protein DI626_03170, partial [Micavibrio aeruginosavorus]
MNTQRRQPSSILAKSRMRSYLFSTALTAAGLIAMSSAASAQNWTDHVAEQPGGISIDTSVPNTTNIQQHLDMVKVRGNGDINAGWTVNLNQPGSSSKYVLYDTKEDPTKILGNLNANGRVYIFDSNGVIFGAGSQVNVGSIVASTGNISDQKMTTWSIGVDRFVDPFWLNNSHLSDKLGWDLPYTHTNTFTRPLIFENETGIKSKPA